MKLSQLIEYQKQMLSRFGDHDVEIAGQKPGKDEELRIIFHVDSLENASYTLRNVKVK